MKQQPPNLVTVRVIAEELGASVDRICRILRRTPHIRPRAYADNLRLFDNTAIAEVQRELDAIDARRAARKGGGDG